MRRLFVWFLCLALTLAAADYYKRSQRRKALGPGIEFNWRQSVKTSLATDLHLASLNPGDEFTLLAHPVLPIGSMESGDGILTNAKIIARVQSVGYSQTLKRDAIIFEIKKIRFPDGKSYRFKAYVYNEDDTGWLNEMPLLLSFLGMEWGGPWIVVGFFVGTWVPYYYGRHTIPLNYATQDIPAGTEIWLKVHWSEYIPFRLKKSLTEVQLNSTYKEIK